MEEVVEILDEIDADDCVVARHAARFTGACVVINDGPDANRVYVAAFLTLDDADADALYRLLEEEVVPAFYDRDRANVPHRWIATVKEAIRTVAPRFSSRRMVKEYAQRMYAPALERKKSEVRG